MVKSFSVIIPAYNCEKVVGKTIESIIESIDYFYANCDRRSEVRSEIIVVNDCSTDGTSEVLSQFVGKKYPVKIINHSQGRGAGASRNTGVKKSQGELIFFCDGDDLYMPEHIYLCYMSLSETPNSKATFSLGNRKIKLPQNRLDGIRTGVKIKDAIDPNWKRAIENTLTINLCLRRECHEFIEGYPENLVYKQIRGREDCAYQKYLARFFKIGRINIETVEYIRYPGNSLDIQIERRESGEGMLESEKVLHDRAKKLEQGKIAYLLEKRQRLSQQDGKLVEASKKQGQILKNAAKLKIKVRNNEYEFIYPKYSCMVSVVSNVLQGKDYPIIKLPGYSPTTIVDIGANVGATAIYLYSAYPNAKIYCYEPSHENFAYLKENTKQFEKIQVFPYGLFEKDCEIPLYKGATNSAQNTVMVSREASKITESIKLVNTSGEMKRRYLTNISILKIDTEGCEVPILSEIFTVVQNIDIIYLEYHSEEDRRELDRMVENNFVLQNMKTEGIHRGTCVYLSKNMLARYPKMDNKRIKRIKL